MRERRHQQRKSGRGEQRAKRALHRSGGHEHRETGGGPPERGRRGETDDSDEEQPFAAEHISQPTAEQQQAAEGERVGRHDPLPVPVGEAERGLRVWQGDVHDRAVQHDHQLGDAQDRKNPPAAIGRGVDGDRWSLQNEGAHCAYVT